MKWLMYKQLRDNFDSDKKRIKIFRRIWKRKKILRKIYFDKWTKMMSFAKKGKVVEIGSGPGTFKEFYPKVILMDIVKNPWIDVVGDGVKLPFKNSSIDTLIFVDVLHHMPDPIFFFQEAERVLTKKGRLIFEEPFISKLSYLIYRLHHEGLNMECYKNNYKLDPYKKALEADLAIPSVMFGKDFKRVKKYFPKLKLIFIDKYDYFFHVFYGNFSYQQILPDFLYEPLKRVEKLLGFMYNICAFKMLVVMEKK